MERQDDGEEPLGGLNHHDRAQEPGSPPLAREHSGSLQQDEPAMMRRSDNYLPVPGEEKNLDVDRSSESIPMKNLYADDVSPLYPRVGPYFSDGRRRVDYVLAYHIQKPTSVRRRSSRFADNNFIRRLRRSLSMRSSRAPLQPKEDPEIAAQEQRTDYHEDDKRFRREEFEENLLETGLELEKDEGNKIPGIGFLKIHAPWNVLCREAEFMKLKMPTKKVYDVKQGSNVVEKIRLFIHKVTAPLHPKVDANRPDSVKSLSHPFSREKQHLCNNQYSHVNNGSTDNESCGGDCSYDDPTEKRSPALQLLSALWGLSVCFMSLFCSPDLTLLPDSGTASLLSTTCSSPNRQSYRPAVHSGAFSS